jgi:hypothetical protein
MNPKRKSGNDAPGRQARDAALLLPAMKGMSLDLLKLVNRMVDGPIQLVLKSDSFIQVYAAKLLLSHSKEQTN